MVKNFGLVPDIKIRRSVLNAPHGVKTTFNVGSLVPLSWQEVLPGDTWKTKTKLVVRLSSALIKPIMDELFMDVWHFFIPWRLVYSDFESVFGVADPSSYVQDNFGSIPTVKGNTVYEKTIADYMDLPIGTNVLPSDEVSVLPFRAYALVYDKWIRNQNVTDETYVQKGATALSETLNNSDFAPNNYTGKLAKVTKTKDYFTACLPSTQKGTPVRLPLGALAPINAKKDVFFDLDDDLQFEPTSGHSPVGGFLVTNNELTSYGHVAVSSNTDSGLKTSIGKTNMYADLSQAVSASVNDLRLSFALQRMLEIDSRGGTRYNEYLLSHFGVVNPDARLQLPEYLGGGRFPLTMFQATSMSNASGASLGEVGGFVFTNGETRFVKGFTEHGMILTVGAVRYLHNYSQGVQRKWFRLNREEFYDPNFAFLGEQPVYRGQIFSSSSESLKAHTFGFQEAWAEYRFIPNTTTGQMRPKNTSSLAVWHLGDEYANAPSLTETFINETPDNLDRCLTVKSNVQDQIVCDMFFDTKIVRPMPVESVPGLIDHRWK